MSNILELLSFILFGFAVVFFLFAISTKNIKDRRLFQGIQIGVTASGFTLLLTSMLVVDKAC